MSTPPHMTAKAHWIEQVPAGDDRLRRVCSDCGFIDYLNPRIVVGAVSIWEDRVLLAKRAIEPRKGYWTVPAGFLELEETLEAGAVRETWEEAGARVAVDALIGVYNIPRIGQVHMMFRAHMLSPDHAAGTESQAVDLFAWDDIPWTDLAFPSVLWALQHYHELRGATGFAPRSEPAAIHWER